MKTAVIRVDASIEIGTGHVMRCLTLAEEMTERGYLVIFITGDHNGNLAHFIESKGFYVIVLEKKSSLTENNDKLQYSHWLNSSQEEDAKAVSSALNNLDCIDLLVIDHYGIDYRWERIFKDKAKEIFVIDDLADRFHDCDMLLDQNFYLDMDNRYRNLVDEKCSLLLGPKYALLRKEFKIAKKNLKNRSGDVSRILVFFGGSDPTNETMKTLESIQLLNRKDITIDVVVGTSNPNKGKIEKTIREHSNMTYYHQVNNIAEMMVKADLAIGAGGSTTWERCYLGLPTITIGVASNQIEILEAVEKYGAIIYLGSSAQVSKKKLAFEIEEILKNKCKLRQLSNQSIKLVND